MNKQYLPLQGKLSIPQVIYEGEPQEVSKELVETLMLSEAVEVTKLDQNDRIPVVVTDETGHRGIDKLVFIDTIAEEAAKKLRFPDIYTTEDIPSTETLGTTDKMLIGTQDGNRIVQNQVLIDLIKDQVGSTNGETNIPLVNNLPAITEITPENKLLIGTDAQNKSASVNGFTEFLKTQDLINLDGKGRPLLPGYGIVTKDVTVNEPSSTVGKSIALLKLSDVSLSESDVVGAIGFVINNNEKYYFDIQVQNEEVHLARTLFWPSLNNKKVRVGIIYKQKIPYEPELTTVQKTFTITCKNGEVVTPVCQLEDLGVSDIKNIISFDIFTDTSNFGFFSWYNPITKYFCICRTSSSPTAWTTSLTVSAVVKDYSTIGPAIVTEGVRMITKNISFAGNGTPNVTVAHISDFEGVEIDDILAVSYVSESLNNISPKAFVNPEDQSIRFTFGGNTGGEGYGKLSLFVKVPVVEPRKPFIKDVEVTLNGTAGVLTGIILDGSEEVGGYTIDNLTSYSVSMITPGKWLNLPTINSAYGIVVSGVNNAQKGKSVVRIKIE